MPKFEIEANGKRYEVEAPDMETAIKALSGQQQPAPEAPPSQPQAPAYDGGIFRAATEGSQAGLMGGFDDEITAGMLAPIDAGIDWLKGDGFDMGKAYTRKQQMLDAQKGARRAEHPIASIGGELAGGLALGTKIPSLAARPAASLLGRVGLGAAEGAGYGALYGAGEAKPGERLSGAAKGGAVGAGIGGTVGLVGGMLARRSARNAMPPPPTSDDVLAQSQALYRASEQQGVKFKDTGIQHLGANLKMAAGRINDRLRPETAGFMDEIDALFNNDMSLEVFDEFRKSLNKSIPKAKPDDVRTLTAMKKVLDHFADNVPAGQMTGGPAGVDMLKEARQMWSRGMKAETVERIMDVADVQTGQYTQSGLANTITREMRTLYKQIVKGKAANNWTKEEIALIRQMAKGGSSSSIVNLFAKFAPRGVVSIIGGQAAGSMIPGVGNIAVPLLGHVAGQAADRAALQAARTLQAGAATGSLPVMQQLPNRLAPLIPGAVGPSMGMTRR